MGEHNNRQRLRPWLEDQINKGRFPGVEWIDKEAKIFKLPWKHGGKQTWQESDSLIFREWAKHTGRYREGDPTDWPNWKTRLRCALNKMPDIQELKEKGNLDGQEPYRVYQFLPKKGNQLVSSHSDSDERENIPMITDSYENHQYPTKDFRTKVELQKPNIPKIVTDIFTGEVKDNSDHTLDQDLKNIDTHDLIGVPQMSKSSVTAMETESVIEDGSFPTDHYTGAPSKHLINISETYNSVLSFMRDTAKDDSSLIQPGENEFIIQIKYRNLDVAQHQIKGEGCRLFYGPSIETFPYPEEQFKMFGPPNMTQIHFPLCTLLTNSKQERLTMQLLNVLDRGLLLHCKNNDIYATRKCRLVIFVVPANSENRQPKKLKRDSEPMKIFDYALFMDCLQKYVRGQLKEPPTAEVLIGFGQDWKSETNPTNNLLISASVFHSLAFYYLAKCHLLNAIDQSICNSSQLQISQTDSMDICLNKQRDQLRALYEILNLEKPQHM